VLVNGVTYFNVDPRQGEVRKMDGEQKMRAYSLATEIMKYDEIDLKAEDIVFIKEGMEKIYSPLIFGQVCNILEGK